MSILSNLLKDVFTKEKHSGVSADDLSPSSVDPLIEQVNLKLTSGDIEGAEKIYKDAIEQFPGDTRLGALQTEVEFLRCLAIVDKRFPGPNYLEWLRWFHAMLKPGNYLEIGVESGQSLQFTRAPTRAVGIDPAIQIVHPQENWVKLFKQTSDDFFATRDPQQVFGSKIINLAFIDGLHTFDQALKDFINVERFSDARSVVLFHDIFPVVPATAQRNRTTRFWVGDTWKVMMILQKHRPDLKIFTIPTRPSGLGVVTGLNPASTILRDDLERICQQEMALELSDYPDGIDGYLHVTKNDFNSLARLLEIG